MLGFSISRTPIFSQTLWEVVECLTYYLFLPGLLVTRLSGADFEAAKLLDVGASLGFAFLTIPLWIDVTNRFIR